MTNSRVRWSTPQLIALSRGAPEERVLLTCKDGWARPSGDPQGSYVAGSYCVKTSGCDGGECCSCLCQSHT